MATPFVSDSYTLFRLGATIPVEGCSPFTILLTGQNYALSLELTITD